MPLEQVRSRLRTPHYSLRTQEAYVAWIRTLELTDTHGPRDIRDRHTVVGKVITSGLSVESLPLALTAMVWAEVGDGAASVLRENDLPVLGVEWAFRDRVVREHPSNLRLPRQDSHLPQLGRQVKAGDGPEWLASPLCPQLLGVD